MWTRFMDMHSGGDLKEKQQYIYIDAPMKEAKVIFYNRFDHNPERVSCTCCGEDYSIFEDKSLKQLTEFDRCHSWERGSKGEQTLGDYKKRQDVLMIPKKDIRPEWRTGEVPIQGYVWRVRPPPRPVVIGKKD